MKLTWDALVQQEPQLRTWEDNARRAGANRFAGWFPWLKTAHPFVSLFDNRLGGPAGRRCALEHIEAVFDRELRRALGGARKS